MKILLIQDDEVTARAIRMLLQSNGFNVHVTEGGEEGVDIARHYDHDLIVLDMELADMSGLEALRHLRAAKVETPVILISANSDIHVKIATFAAGADDFITKPFHRDEFVHRVLAVVRRSHGHAETVISAGPISVHIDAKRASVADRPVHLTGKEYQVLELLALRRGATITKGVLFDHIYGGMDEPELKIIDVFVCKLRRKLGDAAKHVETVWGRGYRLVETPQFVPVPVRQNPNWGRLTSAIRFRLESGPATFSEVREAAETFAVSSVRGTLSRLMGDGEIENIGGQRGALYQLTAKAAA